MELSTILLFVSILNFIVVTLQPAAGNYGGSLFKKPAGIWECDTCMIQNIPEVEKCPACETLRPKPKSTSASKVRDAASQT